MIWDYVLGLGWRIVWMGRNMPIIGLRVSKSLIIPAVCSVVSNLVLGSFLSSSLFHVTGTRKYLEPNKVKFILEKTGGYPQTKAIFINARGWVRKIWVLKKNLFIIKYLISKCGSYLLNTSCVADTAKLSMHVISFNSHKKFSKVGNFISLKNRSRVVRKSQLQ